MSYLVQNLDVRPIKNVERILHFFHYCVILRLFCRCYKHRDPNLFHIHVGHVLKTPKPLLERISYQLQSSIPWLGKIGGYR